MYNNINIFCRVNLEEWDPLDHMERMERGYIFFYILSKHTLDLSPIITFVMHKKPCILIVLFLLTFIREMMEMLDPEVFLVNL